MDDRPSFATVLRRALARRCPVCGAGRIYRSFLRLRRACPRCGWVVEREPGTVTGSMYLISIVTQLFAAALFFVFWLATDWEPWTKIAVAVPVIIVFSVLALPLSKSFWVAVEYYTDLATGEDDRPGYDRRAFRDEPPGEGLG